MLKYGSIWNNVANPSEGVHTAHCVHVGMSYKSDIGDKYFMAIVGSCNSLILTEEYVRANYTEAKGKE